MAWAASPIKAKSLFLIQGKHFTVTNDEVGLLLKSSIKVGISFSASVKLDSKNVFIFSLLLSEAKEGSPSKGKKRVQVKLWSQR